MILILNKDQRWVRRGRALASLCVLETKLAEAEGDKEEF